jgi:hypothetical protein
MRFPAFLGAGLFCLALTLGAAESPTKRYLYLSTPDGAQEGGSGKGILVFDIEQGHKFVRRIDIPFKEGLRGFCGSVVRRAVYYSTTNRRLGAFDLETEKILWEKQYDSGCDRACITPDGKKLYVPTGWWLKTTNSGFLVVNAENGELIKRLPAGVGAHNSLVSLDGQFAYLGTETNLWVFNTRNDSVVLNVKDCGERGVFPFTVDGKNRFAYVSLGRHVGFDVVDLKTGEVPHRVFAHDVETRSKLIPHRTHGVGLTPDEKEIWVSDQDGKKLFIFDNTQSPPREVAHLNLSAGGHGWITFSLDGQYAWCHTPDVFDVKTRQLVATLKDETGKPVSGSKFIEVHFRDGKVVAMGDQFGLGRVR